MYNKYKRKHTLRQIQQMRDLVEQGYAIHYIARKFGCYTNAVWYHVYDLIFPKKVSEKRQKMYLRTSNLTIVKVQKIRKLGVEKRINAVVISKKFGISPTAALSIIKGRTFRWVPGMTKSGKIEPVEYDFKPKTDLVRGPKIGSKQKVKSGVLIKYAKIYSVKPTTVCRWIKLGKLKLKKSEKVLY